MNNISLFWSLPPKTNDTLKSWINSDIELSIFHELSLQSHIKFNNNVTIYTYQNIISDVPKSIKIKSAHDYFPELNAFNALKIGHSIAHVADIVRLKASLQNNAIVMDLDNVIINPLPNIDCFTSTIPAKTTGGVGIKFGKNHPPFKIHDNSWDGKALSAFPLKVHDCIEKEIKELINKIKRSLQSIPIKNSKGWNYVMWTLKEIANNNSLVTVMQPIQFGPLPVWLSSGKCYSLESPTRLNGTTNLYGYILPSIEDIFKNSFCIQHFFESSFKKNNALNVNFWQNVKEGSLLNAEANLIFGKDWKLKFNKSFLDDIF